MTEDDMQHSGSRWEPAPGTTGPAGPGPAPAPRVGAPAGSPGGPYAATATALPPEPDGTPGSRAGRGLIAGIAAGFLVLGGVGGFAVGSATAGNDGSTAGTGTSSVQDGVPGQRPDFGHDGDGRVGGAPGQGGVPYDDNGTGSGTGSGSAPGAVPGGQGATGSDGTTGTT